jgi:hypothetical protein
VSAIASLQPLVIGAVLVWSARVKLFSRGAPAAARRSALARLVGPARAVGAYRAVGGLELLLGVALLAPPAPRIEAVAAGVVGAGFLAYLAYARVAAPGSSCGCLGAARAPIGFRAFARAGALLVAAVAATATTGVWTDALSSRPALAVVVAAELGSMAALSSELDRHWLLPLRRLRTRWTHPLRTDPADVPVAATVEQIHRSGAYRRVAAGLLSDVRDHWDEGEWRIVCYAARVDGEPATAVFAVPRLRFDPGAVRVALVHGL